MKTQIAIEDIYEIHAKRVEINRLSLDEIEWTYDGKVINIDTDTIREFAFTGLNNFDFILSNYYEKKSLVSE